MVNDINCAEFHLRYSSLAHIILHWGGVSTVSAI